MSRNRRAHGSLDFGVLMMSARAVTRWSVAPRENQRCACNRGNGKKQKLGALTSRNVQARGEVASRPAKPTKAYSMEMLWQCVETSPYKDGDNDEPADTTKKHARHERDRANHPRGSAQAQQSKTARQTTALCGLAAARSAAALAARGSGSA